MRNAVMVAVIVCGWLSMSGCSVLMAAHGNDTPDLSVLQVGQARGTVELQMGQPLEVAVDPVSGSTTAVYEYWTGDEGSGGRAVAHGVMDVLTLGLWEVVGTPTEAVLSGKKHRVTVVYDQSGRVVGVNDLAVNVARKEDE